MASNDTGGGRESPATVAIASDHAGHALKADIGNLLVELGYSLLDLGTDGPQSVDYPDFADALADALAKGRAERGVLICGTGIGMAMAANRHRHVRAANCHDTTAARLSRQHNDANVLTLGARTTGAEAARDCVRVFFATAFEGDAKVRHLRRVGKIS